jgi:excisionase family DNA binding protein
MAEHEARTRLMLGGLDRVAEAARFLKLSPSTIYALIGRGVLPSVKIGKARRIPHSAVVDLAARNLVPPAAD